MVKGAVDSLNIIEVARVSSEAVKEVSNMVKEFELFDSRNANLPGWDVHRKPMKVIIGMNNTLPFSLCHGMPRWLILFRISVQS